MNIYYYSTETYSIVSLGEVKSKSTTQVPDWRGEGKNVMSLPYKAIIILYSM